jgi:vacuolar-type H+-ATPase subunit H
MSEKKLLSWVGFKQQDQAPAPTTDNSSAVERIRQLESQLADLKSRRDITSLTREEFELLATETTTTLIRAAQEREKKAKLFAEKLLNDSSKKAGQVLAEAEGKASATLAGAESRARKFLSAAESQAKSLIDSAKEEIENLLTARKREASLILSTAKREADTLVSEATSEVASYRGWLTSAITEADRLYRIQSQSLQAAERAIVETRAKLNSTFERLATLQQDIENNLDENNKPVHESFVTSRSTSKSGSANNVVSIKKKSAPKKTTKPASRASSARR